MKTSLTAVVEFDDQAPLNIFIAEPAQRAFLAQVAGQREAARAAAEVQEAALMRTYHLGQAPTPGRGYDDRLRMRLGCGVDLARELVSSGRIRAQYLGNRYSVAEQAVRDFYAATA